MRHLFYKKDLTISTDIQSQSQKKRKIKMIEIDIEMVTRGDTIAKILMIDPLFKNLAIQVLIQIIIAIMITEINKGSRT